MPNKKTLNDMEKLISEMNRAIDELREKASDNQSIIRNLDRISANMNLLKIGISDVIDLV